ncbi:MAG: hypothetical protein Q8O40_11845 [Chloroflexota bacterium]|nr:hypothetical protein [Chloroflexota bacterium]
MGHTPGPWKVVEDSQLTVSDNTGESAIAYIERYDKDTQANARLIAAAPDLHKAAQAIIKWANLHLPDCVLCGARGLDSDHAQDCPVSIAAAAIAKALKGRSG